MARPRNRADGGEREDVLAIKVEALLDLYGWRWYHTHDSRRSRPGFPDYVALRGPELLFIELKAERGRVKAQQREWLDELGAFAHALRIAAGHAEREGVATAWRHRETGDLAPLTANVDGRYWEAVGVYPTVEVYLWRPSDLDAINERLSRGRHRLDYAG